ncbi:MAG: hypothetical protein CMJ83_04845 [Planctomycetes bacterium]|nr:hypothetical protein [Planctomycetota bacterium]
MVRSIYAALFLAMCTSGAFAQFNSLALNEIYASHTGSDDKEFVEIVGPASMSLNDVVVCVVEGEASSTPGTLDRAYDLSGNTMPLDGYFVLGDSGVAGVDLVWSPNSIENGTETVYLIQTGSPAGTAALVATVGSVIGTGTGIATTTLSTFGAILDLVGMRGTFGGAPVADVNYDAAPVLGPDGPSFFFPAGIFRDGDFPGAWCQRFLDFDDVANANLPRTPGATNSICPCRPFLGYNGNGVLGIEVCPDPGGATATLKVTGAPSSASIILAADVAIAPPGLFIPDGGQYVFGAFPPPLFFTVLGNAAGEFSLTLPASPFGVYGQAFVTNPAVAGGVDISNIVSF